MRFRTIGSAVVGAAVALTVTLLASDLVGIYTVVDKVVLEPADGAPQRIQVWGAFALADRKPGSNYGPAQRGYLYYTCPQGQETICQKEWADLKTVAGKDTGVGFGSRYKETGRIRKPDEKPASPDVYPIERGVIRLSAGHDSLPVIDRIKAALRER